MRCTPIVTGLVLSFTTVSTQAQVSIDVSKITCDQYVHSKIPTPDFASFSAVGSLEARSMLSRWLIAAWLSGYSHAKRNNLIIALESFVGVVGWVKRNRPLAQLCQQPLCFLL